MQEAATWQSAPVPPARGPGRRLDCWLLAVLLLLAIAMHAWVVGHTEVAARDSIGFIRYAYHLQEKPWPEVLRQSEQHPIYPLTVLAMSIPVRHFIAGDLPDLMVLSAQLASSLAAILLVIPMYFLGCELFNRRVGFWAAALFQCLPVSAQVTSDALSEAMFLLFATTAILLASWALRRGSAWLFAASGLVGGLAYLTRPEGALVIGAIGLVILGMQAVQAWRRPWRTVLLHAACLAVPVLLVGSPFVYIIGHVTSKPTGQQLLDMPEFSALAPAGSLDKEPLSPTPPVRSTWAVWWPHPGTQPPLYWGLQALAEETTKSCHYWASFLALVGLVCFRGQFRKVPGSWVMLLVAILHSVVLWRMAVVMGYISERHTLLLVLCALYWAVPTTLALVGWLAGWLGRLAPAWLGERRQPVVLSVLMVLVLGIGLPSALKPLHYNRAGHRAAGTWLAANAQPGDIIVDPFCWAHYYAGWVFREGKDKIAAGQPYSLYAIIECSENPHWRLPMLKHAEKWKEQGTLVFAAPLKSRRANWEQLQIYKVDIPAWPPLPPARKKAKASPSSAPTTD
jgi:hypothetical protein